MAENVEISASNLGNLAKEAQSAATAFRNLTDAQKQFFQGLAAQASKSTISANPWLQAFLPGQQTGESHILQGYNFQRYVAAQTAKLGTLFQSQGAPPIIAPPVIPKGINWGQAGLGAAISPFSPWAGARAMAGSGLFGAGAGAGGAMGGAGMVAFAAALLAIVATIKLAEMAFHNLMKAVEEGSKLYQRGARAGTALAPLAALESALRAAGISPGHASEMLLRAQYPTQSGKTRMNFNGMMLGAWRGLIPIGDLQQMKNMSRDIAYYWEAAKDNARQMAGVAKPLQDTHAQLTMLAREWSTLWQQGTALLATALKPIIDDLILGMGLLNAYLENLVRGLQALHLMPKDAGEGFRGRQLALSGTRPPPASAWERMGLVVGGFGGSSGDAMNQTAQNTRRTAVAAEQSAVYLRTWAGGAHYGMHNLP